MNKKINQWLAFIDDYDREMVKVAEEKNEKLKKARIEMNYLTGEAETRRLAELREKWEMDRVSAINHATRKGKEEQYIEHQGLQGFFQNHEPIYLNLFNLSNIELLEKPSKYKEVMVMENPTVFMEVSEKCNKKDFPLVCTYGQVKLSGLILLDMFVKQGYKICYSGDLDPEGIQIADKLKQRYKDNLNFFGFDVSTYNQNLSNVCLSETRIKKLNGIKSLELLEICDIMRISKKTSFEEENIENIIQFINSK